MSRPKGIPMRNGVIRPRKQGTSKYVAWTLGVPVNVANQIGVDRLSETEFHVELTPEGILYRPIGRVVYEPVADWPVAT